MLNNNNNEDLELFEHYSFVADPGQKPLRIDKFLFDRLSGVSRHRIQLAANVGLVRVGNKPVKSNYKVKPNDVVSVVMDYPKRELEIVPEDLPLNIVYEDNDVLVINKEPGMVVHPGHGNYTGTLIHALAYKYSDLPMFNGEEMRPGLVHRIDKDTSGLLVIAKNEEAKFHLSKQFFNKTTKRTYQALVWGDFNEDEGTIEGNIGRSPANRQIYMVFEDGEYGKHAVTHYKVVERFGYISLVECTLETGRTHQIRVHMKHIGHPIFNDATYGGDKILRGTTYSKYKQFITNCFKELPRQALHAKSLGFVHPTTGKEILFDTELPNDMSVVLSKWRTYTEGRADNK
ncbi:MAG: RluA family pseudouridine synthase [Bacteroidales bacterium]